MIAPRASRRVCNNMQFQIDRGRADNISLLCLRGPSVKLRRTLRGLSAHPQSMPATRARNAAHFSAHTHQCFKVMRIPVHLPVHQLCFISRLNVSYCRVCRPPSRDSVMQIHTAPLPIQGVLVHFDTHRPVRLPVHQLSRIPNIGGPHAARGTTRPCVCNRW